MTITIKDYDKKVYIFNKITNILNIENRIILYTQKDNKLIIPKEHIEVLTIKDFD